MWSLALVFGCGEKEGGEDTATSTIVTTPELDEYNEWGGDAVTGTMGRLCNERCTENRSFWMGSDFAAECPIHEVVLSTFDIDQYEVTLKIGSDVSIKVDARLYQLIVQDPCTIVQIFKSVSSDRVTWQQPMDTVKVSGAFANRAEWEKAAWYDGANGRGVLWHLIAMMQTFDCQYLLFSRYQTDWMVSRQYLPLTMSMAMCLSGLQTGMIRPFMRHLPIWTLSKSLAHVE